MRNGHCAQWLLPPFSPTLEEIARCVVRAAHHCQGRALYHFGISVARLRTLFHSITERARRLSNNWRELGSCQLILGDLSEVLDVVGASSKGPDPSMTK